MIALLSILQYFIQASVDVADKFLISKRKVRPLSYTFYTVVSGALIAVAWPLVYTRLPGYLIGLNMLAGAWFALAYYIFYRALAGGEVSRVIPFVFGLLPVFDLVLGGLFGLGGLRASSVAALGLLIPGALLIAARDGKFFGAHVGLKILAAGMLSCYNLLWHFSSQSGPVLNSLIWNRLGAAAVLVAILVFPSARRAIFGLHEVENKKGTSILFLLKQAVGGANFIFLSFLLSVGPVAVVDSLQGFRYVFIFAAGFFLSRRYRHILDEELSRRIFIQKLFATVLIFLGTAMLFL